MKKNDRFQFVVFKENFLSDIECDKLIQSLDTDELTEGEVVGDYSGKKNINNKLLFLFQIKANNKNN